MSENSQHARKTGRCLCGAVKFEASGPFRNVWNCHCRECAQWSGHHVAATSVLAKSLSIESETELRWFQSSEVAQRGFCKKCGSSLFWRRMKADLVSIMVGALDTPTGLTTSAHMFVDEKSDYYQICDGFAQHGKSPST